MLLFTVRLIVFIAGLVIVAGTFLSAVRTFVLPRSAPDQLTRAIFLLVRRLFDLVLNRTASYEDRDRVMALYAPLALLSMPPVWLICVLIGYMGMFWALGAATWRTAFRISGSSLLTLGFAPLDTLGETILAYSEATLGLILVALLIAYLPTMYSAFQKRETAVTLLEVRAGAPPSAVEMFLRFQRLKRMEKLGELWTSWEIWFAEIEESHTSLPALAFFRSPQPDHSWITAAGAVLDAAALAVSTLDIPHDVQADLCIRAGYLALRRIADFFNIAHNAAPTPSDMISISRDEFDEACRQLEQGGVALKPDRDQAWRDFAGWRVNYDLVLLALCGLTMAPWAPWSSDRSLIRQRAPLRIPRRQRAS
jgi:hypothetical protein